MQARPYVLAEAILTDVRAAGFKLAVLPWGATEAHNFHLPYATDNYESTAIAEEAARKAWSSGGKVVVLPTIPFGVNTGQREVPLCLNMNPSTQQAVIRDILPTLETHGIEKLVILNGHGGNDFRQIIRELQTQTRVLLCQVNWYSCLDPRPFFEVPGDHAGELETSLMMHLMPDLVRPLGTAGPGTSNKFTVQGLRDGWAWTQRHWIRATHDTGVGDPKASTREKGERYFAAVTDRIAGFLVELASCDLEKLYET
jgi:creatinine amidohydrolase